MSVNTVNLLLNLNSSIQSGASWKVKTKKKILQLHCCVNCTVQSNKSINSRKKIPETLLL